jgi:hypothetical protein
MKDLFLALLGLAFATFLAFAGMQAYESGFIPSKRAEGMPFLELDRTFVTVNTTRIGSDDLIETAVAVSHIIYPATESENTPGAVILIDMDDLPSALVAASRVQHFPVNAPLLYYEAESLPELTRKELLRLAPEGVPADGNVQVYIVGIDIPQAVIDAVGEIGYRTRILTAENPIELAVVADDWTSTQHGDHRNEVAIANLDNVEPSIPAAFWNAHMGDGYAFVTSEGVPEATRKMLLRRAHGPWLYLFGDSSIISDATARELAQLGQVTRMKAGDPAGVSAYFSGFFDTGKDWGAWYWQKARSFGWGIAEAGHNGIFVNIGGPGGWANVIPATTLSHMGKHAPVFIINQDGIPDSVRSYLDILKPYPTAPQQQLLNHGWIIGGEETISWETQVEVDGILEAYTP